MRRPRLGQRGFWVHFCFSFFPRVLIAWAHRGTANQHAGVALSSTAQHKDCGSISTVGNSKWRRPRQQVEKRPKHIAFAVSVEPKMPGSALIPRFCITADAEEAGTSTQGENASVPPVSPTTITNARLLSLPPVSACAAATPVACTSPRPRNPARTLPNTRQTRPETAAAPSAAPGLAVGCRGAAPPRPPARAAAPRRKWCQ